VSGVHILLLAAAVVTLAVIIELSRRSQLRMKYTVVWLIVGLAIALLAIAPGLFNTVAHGVGVKSPPDLLVAFAALFLLMVCVYLSWEVGRLEDRSGILAEEVALLRAEFEERSSGPGTTTTADELADGG
jgi:hypothetical protein